MINERTILVIDDDDDLRQSLEEQLAISGEFRVVTTETAAKGIELHGLGRLAGDPARCRDATCRRRRCCSRSRRRRPMI